MPRCPVCTVLALLKAPPRLLPRFTPHPALAPRVPRPRRRSARPGMTTVPRSAPGCPGVRPDKPQRTPCPVPAPTDCPDKSKTAVKDCPVKPQAPCSVLAPSKNPGKSHTAPKDCPVKPQAPKDCPVKPQAPKDCPDKPQSAPKDCPVKPQAPKDCPDKPQSAPKDCPVKSQAPKDCPDKPQIALKNCPVAPETQCPGRSQAPCPVSVPPDRPDDPQTRPTRPASAPHAPALVRGWRGLMRRGGAWRRFTTTVLPHQLRGSNTPPPRPRPPSTPGPIRSRPRTPPAPDTPEMPRNDGALNAPTSAPPRNPSQAPQNPPAPPTDRPPYPAPRTIFLTPPATPDLAPLAPPFNPGGEGGKGGEGGEGADIPWITTPPRPPQVDGGGGGGGVGGADKHWGRHGSFRGGYGGAGGGGLSSGDPSHSDTELGKLSAPHSLLDGECGSMGRGSVGGGSEASERGMDQGRVTAWATSFEKLLEDPAGLHTFAEFLKKEYSHENIYFYTACERYKRLTCQEEMQSTAKKIFERHLCSGAPEPVNVDSQARQDAQDGLHLPSETLFGQAQKQIFNLMKFDSYSRFLKSGLYTDCLNKERRGQPLLYPGDHTLDPDLRLCPDDAHTKLKKSCSDADERRRRSILPPWSRKDRSKSKDRGEAEYRRRRKHQQHQPQHQQHQRLTSDSSSLRSISGSQTSLNSSSDLPMGRRVASRESLTSGGEPGGGGGGSLSGGEGGVGGRSRSSSSTTTCRVFLPDSSKSVVLLRPQETVQEVMARLLERRGLPYTCFEVYMDNNNKVVCRDEDALALKDKKVRLEPRSVFQLVLPCQRPLFVKADPAKAIGDRLKPLLTKAGLKMDLLHVHKEGEEKALNLKGPIGDLDGLKVIVQTKEDVRDWGVEGGRQKRRTTAAGTLNTTSTTTTGSTTSLDDITNRVFQDLRNGKMECFDDFSVIDLDARSTRTDSSDKSSGIQDFCRRNSFGIEKDSSTHRRYKHRTPDIKGLQHHHHHHHHHQDHYHHHHHNAKRRGGGGGGGLNSTAVNGGGGGGGGVVTTDNDNELYEGLKRAQRSRLDDQRGTEINFELPEFLKNDKKQDSGAPSLADQLLARLECSQGGGGAPSPEYFSLAHPEVWGGLPAHPPPPPAAGPPSPNTTLVPEPELDLDDFEDTLRGTEGGDTAPPSPLAPPHHPPLIGLDTGGVGVMPPVLPPSLPSLPLSPPPLPPKPKVGGVRGPPPRPPSRQLHLSNPPPPSFPPPPPSTSNSEEEGVLAPPPSLPPLLPPLHLGRPPPSQEKFNISFV